MSFGSKSRRGAQQDFTGIARSVLLSVRISDCLQYLSKMNNNIISNQLSSQMQGNIESGSLSSFSLAPPANPLTHNQFYNFFPTPPLINELFHRVSLIQASLDKLCTEIQELKNSNVAPTLPSFGAQLPDENSQYTGKTYRISKEFPKHLCCSVPNCGKRYSSRIALKAHIRKCHKEGRAETQ